LSSPSAGIAGQKYYASINLSTNTVETHHTRIRQKFDLHSAAEIVLYAAAIGSFPNTL